MPKGVPPDEKVSILWHICKPFQEIKHCVFTCLHSPLDLGKHRVQSVLTIPLLIIVASVLRMGQFATPRVLSVEALGVIDFR